jgi:serine/threonine protein kinase
MRVVFVMEYCSEGSCLDLMKKYGVFSQETAAVIARGIFVLKKKLYRLFLM